MEPYYYSRMNRTEQSAYHAMKTGLTALAPSFTVPRLENRELADIFFRLRRSSDLTVPNCFTVPDSTTVFTRIPAAWR